jgi:hypothetical protein|nr:MAG TPA: hypothetical protein [Caudoviricetes sp.]
MKLTDIVPSDYVSVYLTQFYLNYQGPARLGVAEVDLTEAYDVYVEEIEQHNNLLHKQKNYLLFKFIVDYYTVLWTHRNVLSYMDGTINHYGTVIEDLQLDQLDEFVTVNNIPFGYPGVTSRETWEYLSVNGNLDRTLEAILNAFKRYNIRWDNGAMYNRLDRNNNGVMYLPIRWHMRRTDPAEYRSMDINEYRRTFKYEVSLTVSMAVVPLDDVIAIGPTALERTILNCLDPVALADIETGGPDE